MLRLAALRLRRLGSRGNSLQTFLELRRVHAAVDAQHFDVRHLLAGRLVSDSIVCATSSRIAAGAETISMFEASSTPIESCPLKRT